MVSARGKIHIRERQKMTTGEAKKQEILLPGNHYEIIHVRASWPSWTDNPDWLLFIGPLHVGKTFIGFKWQHRQVDYRLLSKEDLQRAERIRPEPLPHKEMYPVFNCVILQV